MSKPKVAFFDFTGCEGCQVEVANFDQDLLKLLEAVEVVEFREIMKETCSDPLDIAFVEGSFTREKDRARLEEIRHRAKVVVAYGSCAATGGINALKNHQPEEEYKTLVYGQDAAMPHLETGKALPISAAIPVDLAIPGCPVDRREFARLVSDLLHGKTPSIPNYSVCMECKKRENICRYELGDTCLGPIARAGCGALCPSNNVSCEACRGFVDTPNTASMVETLTEAGLDPSYARIKAQMFTANLLED
jgi:coenzyme F420-reducing hydrogenase gamma subunit